jgi:DNA-binding transcriptional LysR family regulator
LIESYRSRYPKVRLSIESGWSPDIASRLASYNLDLGLVLVVSPEMQGSEMQGYPQLAFVPLAVMDLVFVTAPGGLWAKKRSVTWDDLGDAWWILNQEGCQFRAFIERQLKERGHIMKVEVEIIGFELQKRLTQLGLGISLLPKSFALKEIQQGSLKTLNVKGTKLQGYSCLVFRKDKYINGVMKGFFKLLQETYDPPKNGLRKFFEPV